MQPSKSPDALAAAAVTASTVSDAAPVVRGIPIRPALARRSMAIPSLPKRPASPYTCSSKRWIALGSQRPAVSRLDTRWSGGSCAGMMSATVGPPSQGDLPRPPPAVHPAAGAAIWGLLSRFGLPPARGFRLVGFDRGYGALRHVRQGVSNGAVPVFRGLLVAQRRTRGRSDPGGPSARRAWLLWPLRARAPVCRRSWKRRSGRPVVSRAG